MTKSNEEKPKYESPVVVKLNEVGNGSGATVGSCLSGSNASQCASGASAIGPGGFCLSGGTATSTCNTGTTPNVA